MHSITPSNQDNPDFFMTNPLDPAARRPGGLTGQGAPEECVSLGDERHVRCRRLTSSDATPDARRVMDESNRISPRCLPNCLACRPKLRHANSPGTCELRRFAETGGSCHAHRPAAAEPIGTAD